MSVARRYFRSDLPSLIRIFERCSKILTFGFAQINFANHSLNRIFDLSVEDTSVRQCKKKRVFFCVALT